MIVTHYLLQTGGAEPQLHGPFPTHTQRDSFVAAEPANLFPMDVRYLAGEVVLEIRSSLATPVMTIIDQIDPDNFYNHFGTTYTRSNLMRVWTGAGTIRLTDISKAMRPGHTCIEFSLHWNHRENIPAFVQELLGSHRFDFRAIHATLATRPWVRTGPFNCFLEHIVADANPLNSTTIYTGERESKRLYTPFWKPSRLESLPAKWTIAHVKRALLNGQYAQLQCNGVYSDDYAYDAAVNFQKGRIADAAKFVRRLVESPSGWWCYQRDRAVGVCCHHFDSNSFIPNLGAGSPNRPSSLVTIVGAGGR
ncbi:MAG: hypothetical protein QOF48_3970 [Verrucomicrobiota bacterium]|jgi:hypothetical protein